MSLIPCPTGVCLLHLSEIHYPTLPTMTSDTSVEPTRKTEFVSISEGARLVGKSRPVLYDRNKAGLLSFTRDAEGKRVVSVAELIRCFGTLVLDVAPTDLDTVGDRPDSRSKDVNLQKLQLKSEAPTPSDTSRYLDQLRKTMSLQKELALTKQGMERERELNAERLEDLKTQIDDYRQQTDHWREAATDSIKLLEHHQDQEAKKGFWARLLNL